MRMGFVNLDEVGLRKARCCGAWCAYSCSYCPTFMQPIHSPIGFLVGNMRACIVSGSCGTAATLNPFRIPSSGKEAGFTFQGRISKNARRTIAPNSSTTSPTRKFSTSRFFLTNRSKSL